MMYCNKHCCWFYALKCPKCVDGEPAHIREKNEIADPNERRRLEKLGWCK